MPRPKTAKAEKSLEAPTKRARAVVVSDIHATVEKSDETHVATKSAKAMDQNALTSIGPYLKDKIIEADLLICPGDLIHRGNSAPMKWVWKELNKLADQLGAALLSTAGNHDMALLDPKPGVKPSSALRKLEPKFPTADTDEANAYWANGFTILKRGSARILLLNSSDDLAFNEKERDHGRFGADCEQELREALGDSPAAINLCVAHHHPQEWTMDSEDRLNHMLQGDRLISILEMRPEPWILIHGHSHFPRLDYIGNRSGGPIRLASASIGANLLEISGTKVRNQFHILDFDLKAAAELGLRVAGVVESHDWVPGVGWELALADSGLPVKASFGYRRDGYEIAHWLQRQASSGQKSWSWAELEALEPRLRFLSAGDRDDFFNVARRLGAGVVDELLEVTFP